MAAKAAAKMAARLLLHLAAAGRLRQAVAGLRLWLQVLPRAEAVLAALPRRAAAAAGAAKAGEGCCQSLCAKVLLRLLSPRMMWLLLLCAAAVAHAAPAAKAAAYDAVDVAMSVETRLSSKSCCPPESCPLWLATLHGCSTVACAMRKHRMLYVNRMLLRSCSCCAAAPAALRLPLLL